MPEAQDKTKEYQRRYYVENRDKISARKRRRYAEDPKVREAARKKAMARYLQSKAKNGGERKVRSRNHPRVVVVDGETQLFHCVREFAERVGRNVQTITKWEAAEVIPAPPMVDKAGRRWYSEHHMDTIAKAVAKYDKSGRRDLSLLSDFVQAQFNKAK